MMSKQLFSSLKCYQSIQRLQFSSQKPHKVLGYKTKPSEDEIKADYIGKNQLKFITKKVISFRNF